jgi:hypothetical protein
MVTESIKCAKCGNKVSFHRRTCEVCENDIGFPNVRLAKDEEGELLARYKEAFESASAKNTTDVLVSFEKFLENTNVIITRSLSKLIELANQENQMLTTFYSDINANARIAGGNEWDRGRQSADSAINPLYVEHIHYAVISAGSFGPTYYGECHIMFKDELIKDRTSFFEENPFIFCLKHQHITGSAVPRGYRSDWDNKTKLTIAKLHGSITNKTPSTEYEGLLISDNGGNSDFIEAHIYGAISRATFEEVTVVNLDTSQTVLLMAHRSKLEKSGIKLNIGNL